jgi:hypothetical protein
MSEDISTNLTTEVSMNQKTEMSNFSSQYKFWGRFNQILVGIGGVFSVPFGIPAIVAAVKLNKSIENVDEVSKDSSSQEFVESVKDFHKWLAINFIVILISTFLIGILVGGLIFATFAGIVNEGKKGGSIDFDDNASMEYKKPKSNRASENKNILSTDPKNINTDKINPFNINTEEGSMSLDKDGNMKIIDKDGKVTTVNIDGTLGSEK